MKHTIATCAYLLAILQWMLIDAELDDGTELDAMAWRLDLGCAQREFGREAQATRGKSSARREARGRRVRPVRPTGRSVESITVILKQMK